MTIEFYEAALFDLKKSKKYYSDIEPDLGIYFLNDIEHAISDIKKTPQSFFTTSQVYSSSAQNLQTISFHDHLSSAL